MRGRTLRNRIGGQLGHVDEVQAIREKIRLAREKAAALAVAEEMRIQAEKEALRKLTEKDLIIEAITSIQDCSSRLAGIETGLSAIEWSVDSLSSSTNN
jgi:hypothetical protein